jgi:His/Glu/Gln/Arg/opine family amino acid ABC transporter permease subunit
MGLSGSDWLALLEGAVFTVALSLTAVVIGVPAGLGLALIRWMRVPVLAPIVAVVVSVLRAAPAVTLALLIFFALPSAGLSLERLPAAIATLTLSTAAFNCEIWRASLLALPADQMDAALAMGMRRGLRLRRIVLPQVARAALPALVSEVTLLVKVSPAVAVLGVVDITRAAVRIGAQTYEPLPPFMAALVIYSLIVFAFVRLQRMVERRGRLAHAT